MTATQLKSYMSRYHLTSPELAKLLGLTTNYIYQIRGGRQKISAWIEAAVKDIARGRYKGKPDNLNAKTRYELENRMQPYLRELTEKAMNGYYQFY